MNFNVPMMTVKPISDTRRSSQSMSLIELLARSAIAKWQRFTQYQESILKVQDSIQRISSYAHLWITWVQNITLRSRHAELIHMLDWHGTLRREPIRGSERAASRLARSVALAIGISLSLGVAPADGGSIDAIQSVRQLADYQLTDKQYHCHNQIIYRESRFNRLAVNGSHYGYYQGKSKALKGAAIDYQFYWYWAYVSQRYGVTRYDEPNYCNALHHLRVKGWQ